MDRFDLAGRSGRNGEPVEFFERPTAMTIPKAQDPGDISLVFAANNTHSGRCGEPPRLRNTDNLGLYYGYFENRYGEQFVFTFDRATKTGTVSGGDLGWGNPKSFTRTPGRGSQ